MRSWARACGFHGATFYLDALIASLVLFFGAVLVGLLVVFTVPRVLNRCSSSRTRSIRCTVSATRSTGRSRA